MLLLLAMAANNSCLMTLLAILSNCSNQTNDNCRHNAVLVLMKNHRSRILVAHWISERRHSVRIVKEQEICRPSILKLHCLQSTPGPFSDYLRLPPQSF